MSTSPFRKNEASAEALPQEKARSFRWEYILVPFALLVFGYMLLQSLWIYVNSQTLLPSSAVNIPLQSEIEKTQKQESDRNAVQSLISKPQNEEKAPADISTAINENLNQEINKIVEAATVNQVLKEENALGSKQIEKTALVKTPETVRVSPSSNTKKVVQKDKKKDQSTNKKKPTKALKPKPQKVVKKTIKKTVSPKKKETVKKKRPVRSSKQTQENDFQVLEQSLGL